MVAINKSKRAKNPNPVKSAIKPKSDIAINNPTEQGKKVLSNWQKFIRTLGWCLWVIFAYVLASLIAVMSVKMADQMGIKGMARDDLFKIMLIASATLGTGLIAIGLPWLIGRARRDKTQRAIWVGNFIQSLAITNKLKARHIKNIFAALGLYYLISIIVFSIATLIAHAIGLSGNAMNQTQEIGLSSNPDIAYIIFSLVSIAIIAPLVEELVFRGMLYGRLKNILVTDLAVSIVVSLVFAMAHGQLNVALATFILSMVLCRLRRQTGSIWGGVMVHSFVNGLALVIYFISPGLTMLK